MALTRIITIEIPEEVAKKIEHITGREIDEVASELLRQYFTDERRTQIPVKKLAIRFPTDWFAMMLQMWGEGKISHKVRDLIYQKLKTSPRDSLTSPPVWKDRHAVMTSRQPTPVDGGLSCIKQIVVPMDWYTRLLELHGNYVSTYVKSLVYNELKATQNVIQLSFPRQLDKFVRRPNK